MLRERSTFWLLLTVVAYSIAQLIWYWDSPLLQSPVLDGQENLILAAQISEGALAQEPFYRAILYPALLSVIPLHFAVLGFFLHFANTLLVIFITHSLWRSKAAALISGALVGLNPVLLHFTFDPLDITLSITLFLASIASVLKGLQSKPPKSLPFILSALFLTLACLARPHFFAVLAPTLLISLLLAIINRSAKNYAFAFIAPAILILLSFGTLQALRSQDFRILPWQGSYNLWANNHPGSNGLYLTQSLSFHYTGQHQNPARLESEYHYRKDTGNEGPIDIDTFNEYWKTRAFNAILEDPTAWLKLMLYKSYALINNFEQYNNKTYSFHKELSPVLKYNPISWGLLLTLALLAAPLLSKREPSKILYLASIIILYSAGVLLYMASARFRLPLVPILSILAGGSYFYFKYLILKRHRPLLIAGLAIALPLVVISFSRFGDIASRQTYVQDAMLLADASAKLQRDREAYYWADQALNYSPDRPDAKRLRLISFYNLVAYDQLLVQTPDWTPYQADLEIPLTDPTFEYVKGIAYWNLNQKAKAQEVWLNSFLKNAWNAQASLSALIYTKAEKLPSNYPPITDSANLSQLVHTLRTSPKKITALSQLASQSLPPNLTQLYTDLLPRVLPPIIPKVQEKT
ncbi:MAG: hypothetical protein AAGB46_08795 [Verrucomicrobiota bacterium]